MILIEVIQIIVQVIQIIKVVQVIQVKQVKALERVWELDFELLLVSIKKEILTFLQSYNLGGIGEGNWRSWDSGVRVHYKLKHHNDWKYSQHFWNQCLYFYHFGDIDNTLKLSSILSTFETIYIICWYSSQLFWNYLQHSWNYS